MTTKKNRGNSRYNNNRGRSSPYRTRSSTNSGTSNIDRRAVLEDAYDNHQRVRPDPSSLDEEDMETDDQLGNEAETSAAGSNRNNNNPGSSETTARDRENTSNGTNQKEPTGKDNSDDAEFVLISRHTRFRALAPIESIPGKNLKQKEKFVGVFYAKYKGYAGSGNTAYKSVRYACVYFDTQEDLQLAIGTPLTVPDSDPVKFEPHDVIIKKPTPDEVQRTKSFTIQVLDIPLPWKGEKLRPTFSKYGEITQLNMVTKQLYQHAYITYKNNTNMSVFRNLWATLIENHSVRILPLTLSTEDRELRRKYVLKLTGLPPNTAARDLLDVTNAVHAASCFIPRTVNNYRPLNYAYISFASEELQAQAATTHYALENHKLYWVKTDHKTCHYCGHPGHIVKNCEVLKNKKKTPRQRKLDQLYNKYRPA
jgi:hypothetical protein